MQCALTRSRPLYNSTCATSCQGCVLEEDKALSTGWLYLQSPQQAVCSLLCISRCFTHPSVHFAKF